jgi:hypothetical protein
MYALISRYFCKIRGPDDGHVSHKHVVESTLNNVANVVTDGCATFYLYYSVTLLLCRVAVVATV